MQTLSLITEGGRTDVYTHGNLAIHTLIALTPLTIKMGLTRSTICTSIPSVTRHASYCRACFVETVSPGSDTRSLHARPVSKRELEDRYLDTCRYMGKRQWLETSILIRNQNH
jgi:hypothetical protein